MTITIIISKDEFIQQENMACVTHRFEEVVCEVVASPGVHSLHLDDDGVQLVVLMLQFAQLLCTGQVHSQVIVCTGHTNPHDEADRHRQTVVHVW